MTLSLNYQQRINLILLVGAQRGNVAEMRLFWGLQDRLELNDEEKRSIDYRLEPDGNGFEQPRWNFVKARDCAPLSYDLSEGEAQRVRRMVDEWAHFLAAVDRVWMEPLIEQSPVVAAGPPAEAMSGMRM